LIPKFARECAARAYELQNRDTSLPTMSDQNIFAAVLDKVRAAYTVHHAN